MYNYTLSVCVSYTCLSVCPTRVCLCALHVSVCVSYTSVCVSYMSVCVSVWQVLFSILSVRTNVVKLGCDSIVRKVVMFWLFYTYRLCNMPWMWSIVTCIFSYIRICSAYFCFSFNVKEVLQQRPIFIHMYITVIQVVFNIPIFWDFSILLRLWWVLFCM